MKKAFLTSSFLFTIVINSFSQLAEEAEDISPLLISEKVPAVSITSIEGEKELLTDIVNKKPSILIFYRGGWCRGRTVQGACPVARNEQSQDHP